MGCWTRSPCLMSWLSSWQTHWRSWGGGGGEGEGPHAERLARFQADYAQVRGAQLQEVLPLQMLECELSYKVVLHS
jgi:hypothetical protein